MRIPSIKNPALRWLAGVAVLAAGSMSMLYILMRVLDLYLAYSAEQHSLGMQFALFGVWAALSAAVAYAAVQAMRYGLALIGATKE